MKPKGKIVPTPLTTTVITPDNTLVDDTVALVDDPTVLVGSQVTPANIRASIKPTLLRTKVELRR